MATVIFTIDKKIKAATLIETIVALTVSLVVFGITAALFVQVTSGSRGLPELKVESAINTYISETEQGKEYFDSEKVEDKLQLRRQLIIVTPSAKFVQINFSVSDMQGRTLLTLKKIFLR